MTFLHHTGEHLARFVGRTTAKPTNQRTSTTPLLEMEDGCSGNLLCTTNARLIQSTWLHTNVFKCKKWIALPRNYGSCHNIIYLYQWKCFIYNRPVLSFKKNPIFIFYTFIFTLTNSILSTCIWTLYIADTLFSIDVHLVSKSLCIL